MVDITKPYMITSRSYTLHLEGDRVEDTPENCDADYISDAASVDEARSAIERLEDSYHEVSISATRHGIGSVTRLVFDIERLIPSEDGEEWDGGELMDSIDVLNEYPAVKRAWELCKSSFYGFLDYESDGCMQLNEVLCVDATELGEVEVSDEGFTLRFTCYLCSSPALGSFAAVHDDELGTLMLAGGLSDRGWREGSTTDELAASLLVEDWWGAEQAQGREDKFILSLVAAAI